MAKIRQSNLDGAIVTGLTELSESRADTDFVLIYDLSTNSLKKIQASNLGILNPTISSVSPTNVNTGDGTGNATITITGTNFATGSTAVLVTEGGSEVAFDSVSRDSGTQLTGTIAISSLSNANEPYDVKVTSNGISTTITDQININAQPVYVTASGSLGTNIVTQASSFSVNATDPESAGNVTFELQSGALPPGYSITNTAADGGTAIISGTDSTTSSTTTYNFVLRAVDAASNTTSRAFSIESRVLTSQSFTSSGTFSVPSGITQGDVLVVASGAAGAGGDPNGGGGGAGGLVFYPNYPLTPGGTVSVTVGNQTGQDYGIGPDGNDSVFGTLTAKGGGRGGYGQSAGPAPGSCGGNNGGSGGGGGGNSGSQPGGTGTQPTLPGQGGAYGFGNPGGSRNSCTGSGGAGGGGAGSAGAPGQFISGQPCWGGNGGSGKFYTIADGTTPVGYAGGGGGNGPAGSNTNACAQNAGGGLGHPNFHAQPGAANRGGGGGAGNCYGGYGGKGVVIIRY
jgi:hypothetical protein